MKKIRFVLPVILNLFLLQLAAQAQTETSPTIWNLDRVDSIGGCLTTVLPDQPNGPASNLPTIVNTEQGRAASFNGMNDGFLIKGNPLGRDTTWTLELIFKPDTSSNPDNIEQRFFHIAPDARSSARLLLELRLVSKQRWALDLCMNSGGSTLIIFDSVKTRHLYPAAQWCHLAVVYENQTATTYVNGVKDSSGTVLFKPLVNAQTSLGARQNPKSWFKGMMSTIKVTPRALTPVEFLKLKTQPGIRQ